MCFLLVGNVGEKCHLACSLNSYGELSLVKSAGAGNTSGEDFCSLGNELSELCNILVINVVNLILAEDANLLSSVHRTEGGTLSIVSFHLISPITFPTHNFYIAPAVVSLTEEDRNLNQLEGKISVVRYFFKISTGRTVKCGSAVCIGGISRLRGLSATLSCGLCRRCNE